MITKDNNLKVMELFFKFPHRNFHIREIARLTGLSSTGVIKIVKRLNKEKLLVTHKRKNIEEIKPDFNGRFLLIKRLYNIYSLYDTSFIDFIKKYYEMPQAIILFGSYSDGTDTERSDIDIAIISNKKGSPYFKKFEDKLARKINMHLIDLDKTEKEFKNSLSNGIILEGFMEIIK
jgi:predicted nucleotidyltransferase